LTLPVINHAAAVMVLVSGRGKSAMLERAVRASSRRPGGSLLPIELIHPETGALDYLADAEAAPWARAGRAGLNS
ncbi:MAG TPA: 6-phosphogluconolactonase, partial [Candidatus Eisenbacteria bacterium]|nr:6-phosphogluconolactonase [Candidatus Eisenbacteria bacterium]